MEGASRFLRQRRLPLRYACSVGKELRMLQILLGSEVGVHRVLLAER